MSETTSGSDAIDPSTQPDYEQLGEKGNPFTQSTGTQSTDADGTADGAAAPGIDNAPGEHGYEDDPEQNAALPDWGPTDGTHGVDGADPDA